MLLPIENASSRCRPYNWIITNVIPLSCFHTCDGNVLVIHSNEDATNLLVSSTDQLPFEFTRELQTPITQPWGSLCWLFTSKSKSKGNPLSLTHTLCPSPSALSLSLYLWWVTVKKVRRLYCISSKEPQERMKWLRYCRQISFSLYFPLRGFHCVSFITTPIWKRGPLK